MPTYLMTVYTDTFECGFLRPQIRLSRFRHDPALRSVAPGSKMQLRRPDGTRQSIILDALSVDGLKREGFSLADDATLYSFTNDPMIQLFFEPMIIDAEAPEGSELWLID